MPFARCRLNGFVILSFQALKYNFGIHGRRKVEDWVQVTQIRVIWGPEKVHVKIFPLLENSSVAKGSESRDGNCSPTFGPQKDCRSAQLIADYVGLCA